MRIIQIIPADQWLAVYAREHTSDSGDDLWTAVVVAWALVEDESEMVDSDDRARWVTGLELCGDGSIEPIENAHVDGLLAYIHDEGKTPRQIQEDFADAINGYRDALQKEKAQRLKIDAETPTWKKEKRQWELEQAVADRTRMREARKAEVQRHEETERRAWEQMKATTKR